MVNRIITHMNNSGNILYRMIQSAKKKKNPLGVFEITRTEFLVLPAL